jgi:hypothetical protein
VVVGRNIISQLGAARCFVSICDLRDGGLKELNVVNPHTLVVEENLNEQVKLQIEKKLQIVCLVNKKVIKNNKSTIIFYLNKGEKRMKRGLIIIIIFFPKNYLDLQLLLNF